MTTTQPTALATGKWTLDPAACTATFRVKNFGRTVHGSVPFLEGTVEVDEDGRLSAVRGSLDLSAIKTGNPRRDEHLRKPNLLDLDNHPTMTFVARTVTPFTEGWHVTGRLRVRNVAIPVTGDVKLSAVDSGEATLTARAQFDRKPIGIRAPRFVIGRFIEVSITATVRPGQA